MEVVATLALNAGLAVQNYFEWLGGGPKAPRPLTLYFPADAPSPATRMMALLIASTIVALLSVLGLSFNWGWLIACIATALMANAIFQLIASIYAAYLIPGTVSGVIFMLPTSVWALWTSDNHLGWVAIVAGPLLSAPILLLTWFLAMRLTGMRLP